METLFFYLLDCLKLQYRNKNRLIQLVFTAQQSTTNAAFGFNS